MTMTKKILFPFTFLLSFLIFSSIVTKLKVPILEGQKFGNILLERKIQKLIELEKSDGVDAIFLGASTVDFGISAKTFSEQISSVTGKKFVAFNFGMGGGDYFIWSDFIKLIHLYAKPKYFIVPGVNGFTADYNFNFEGSYINTLQTSPVGRFLTFGMILQFMNRAWDSTVFSSLPSLRSKIIFGKYSKSALTISDFYFINEYGDSLSYNYIYLNEHSKLVNQAKGYFLNSTADTISSYSLSTNVQEYEVFFKLEKIRYSLDIGYEKIIRQTKDLNVKIFIVTFPLTAIESTFENNELFLQMNERYSVYFKQLSRFLGVSYLNALEDLTLKPWHVQDDTHYNTFAAEIIGRKLAEKFLNKTLPNPPEPNDDALFELEKEKLMGRWTSIIRSPKDLEENILIVKYLQNANTLSLPPSSEKVNLIIRLEKNKSQIFPAQRIDSNSYQVEIPKNLLKANAMYAADLLNSANISLSAPLESYSWKK